MLGFRITLCSAADLREDQVKFVRLDPKMACLRSTIGTGFRNHAQKELRLPSFLAASSNDVDEILLRYGIVGFTVITSNAGPGAG